MGRILVVEDDRNIRALIRVTLEDERGLELQEAGTLEAARAALGRGIPDVVLLDLHLPDGEGIDLLASIPRTTRVVAMTGSGRVLDDTGHTISYLPKPFDPKDLEWLVGLALRGPRSASARP